MKMFLFSKIPLRTVIVALAIAALAMCAASTALAQQGVLFYDTFDVSAADQDINTDINLRQSGAFVTQLGSVSYYQNALWGGNVVNPTGWTPAGTLVNYSGGFVSTQQNFGGVFSQGGLTVEYDLNATLNAWGWAGVGQTGQEYFSGNERVHQPGIGLITLTDGAVSVWQKFVNDVVPPAAGGDLPVSIADQVLHHYKVEFTDPTDGNPFDGQGQTDVTYYIQDSTLAYQPITTQVFTNGGLPSAVVTLQGLNTFSQWDNLKVTGNVAAFANPWIGDGTITSWSDSGNWTTGIPNGAGSIAAFFAPPNSEFGTDVTVDVAPTVGSIVFSGPYVQLMPDGVNNYTIILDNSPNSGAATIDALSGANWIMVPLALNSNLAITVGSSTVNSVTPSLTLTAGLSADGRNVTVTCPVSINYWDNSTYTALPGGAFTVSTANVTGIGTLSLNYINAYVSGITLEAEAVTGGSAALYLQGSNLYRPGTTENPSVDVLYLDITGGISYTVGTGKTVRTSALASSDNSCVFTLDGGTLAINPANSTGFIGAGLGGAPAKALAAFYLTANGGTLDCGNQWVGFNASLTGYTIDNAPGVETSGVLTITGGGAYSTGVPGNWNGGTVITGGTVAYVGTNSLGSGKVVVKDLGQLCFAGGTGGTFTNELELHGPGLASSAYTTLSTDWNTLPVEVSGPITLFNTGDVVSNDPLTFPEISNTPYASPRLTLSGKITGAGGVVIGTAIGGNSLQLGTVHMTGTVANDHTGDTYVCGELLALGKDNSGGVGDNTAVAVPNKLVLEPYINGKAFVASCVYLEKPNQTGTNTIVQFNSPEYPALGEWSQFSLQGYSTTVRGLNSGNQNGLNAIDNLSAGNYFKTTYTGILPMDEVPVDPATTPSTLTITTQVGDDFTYSGYIKDDLTAFRYGAIVGASLGIVKDGPGIQRFVPSYSLQALGGDYTVLYSYTGGTTVNDGTLDVSLVPNFTPNGEITVEGTGIMLAGALSTDQPISVLDNGVLNATSIVTPSLTIGGFGIGTGSLATVPEPSTLVLLALAGLGALLAWRRK